MDRSDGGRSPLRKEMQSEGIPNSQSVSLWELVRYFLRLGSFGFGGPIALAGYMQRDLVPRGWITSDEYKQGLAFAQMMPGRRNICRIPVFFILELMSISEPTSRVLKPNGLDQLILFRK
jgi:chromate transporter